MSRGIVKYLLVALLAISVHSTKENWPNEEEIYVSSTDNSKSSEGVGESSKPETVSVPDDAITQQLIFLDEILSECGPYGTDIREITIVQIQEHFRNGTLTSVDLTQCYLKRIYEIDYFLRSVIEINPDAIALAEKADIERSAGLNVNRIHGIPILLKDNIGTADSMQTTAGALALENLKPIRDADVVTRLREAGAIILGKASLSEWANWRGNIPSGWNGRRGQTVNAYVLSQNPSGSSSGSAVSISVNLASISLGSETDGSIISPSTRSAIVGLKPTLAAVPSRGVIPLSPSNDVVGPMVRSVEDATILMGVISDIDLQGCDVDISTCFANRDFKIGVLRDPFWNPLDPSLVPIIPVLEDCLNTLSAAGFAEVIDPVRVPFNHRIDRQRANVIFRHEFKYYVNQYLQSEVHHVETDANRTIFSLADVINFNELNPPAEGYNQNTLILSEATNGLWNKTYQSILHEYRRDSVRYLNSILDGNEVDALATPCFSSGTPLLYSYGAAAGYPSLTVPVGTYNTGLPFGICLLGRPFSEALLLKLGFFIEQSRPSERPVPRFLN